ncbi:hypothetical protein ACFE04_029487 [Oxalis oulophora]
MKQFPIMNVMLVLLFLIGLPLIIASSDEISPAAATVNTTTTSRSLWNLFDEEQTIKIQNKNEYRHLGIFVHCKLIYGDNRDKDFGVQKIKTGHSWGFSITYNIFSPPDVECTFRWAKVHAGGYHIFRRRFVSNYDVTVKPDGPGCKLTIGDERVMLGSVSFLCN